MAGLDLAWPGYPRGSAHRLLVSAARAKALCLQNFAAGRPMYVGPVLKRARMDSRDKPGHDDKG
jgi:hypothetical protein